MKTHSFFCGIHGKLFLAMIVVPAVPLLMAAVMGYHFFAETTERLAVDTIRLVAIDHEKMIAGFLNERRSDLESLIKMTPADTLEGETAQREIEAMQKATGDVFNDMGLIGPDGIQKAYVGPYPLLGNDYRESIWYREALAKGYFISDVFLGYRNVPHFVIAIARKIGGRQWVLRATVNTGVFDSIVEAVNIGDSGEAYILNGDNVFQTKRRSGGDLLERNEASYPKQHNSIETFMLEEHGTPYLCASASMNDGKWRLVVRQKKAEAFRSTTLAAYAVIFTLICGGVVILGLAIVVSRWVVDAIRKERDAVDKLQNQLLQAARLAELGEMSAGFAHEINNPLQIMKTDLALLDLNVRDLGDNEGNEEQIAEIKDVADQFRLQIDRCAAITKEILRFGRPRAPEPQHIDLSAYLPEVGAMVENKAAVHGINLHYEIHKPVPGIEADPGQLQQVMVNLINNAIHAVVDQHGADGGDICIAASGDSAGHAVIKISDNGCGIPEDSLAKIFVPFFTTKAPGQGTGMGLPVCHTIIDSMGGEIAVESCKGEGTVFTITIPASAQ